MKFPAIVQLKLENDVDQIQRKASDHFIVVWGWDRKQGFRVFDPPREHRWMTTAEMKRLYSGIGLVVANEKLESAKDGFYRRPPRAGAMILGCVVGVVLVYSMRFYKSKFPLMLVLLLVVGCGKAPSNTIDAHQFDAGLVVAGKPVKHRFAVYNHSPALLKFVSIEGDCRCSKTLEGELPLSVAPGDFAEATVEVDTSGSQGPTERKFVALTDSENPVYKAIPLVLRYDAEKPMRPVNNIVFFGKVIPKETKVQELLVPLGRLAKDKDITIDCASPWFDVSKDGVEDDLLSASVTLKGEAKPHGTLVGEILVSVGEDQLAVPAVARIMGDIEVIPDRIWMGNLRRRAERYQQKLRLKSRDGREFQIKDVQCPEGLVLEGADSTLNAAKDVHIVTIGIDDKDKVGFEKPMSIWLDHPSDPEILVYPLCQYR